MFLTREAVLKARHVCLAQYKHSALDAEFPQKIILIIRGLRVKPAMTNRVFRLLRQLNAGKILESLNY